MLKKRLYLFDISRVYEVGKTVVFICTLSNKSAQLQM